MPGDKGHHFTDFPCILIFDVAAMEVHSSDLPHGRALPGTELTGGPSCPHDEWRHASPSCSTRWLNVVGLLVLALRLKTTLFDLADNFSQVLWCLRASLLNSSFSISFTSIRLDLKSKVSFCLLLFSICLLTRNVKPPDLACQALPWLPRDLHRHSGNMPSYRNTGPLSRVATLAKYGAFYPCLHVLESGFLHWTRYACSLGRERTCTFIKERRQTFQIQ